MSTETDRSYLTREGQKAMSRSMYSLLACLVLLILLLNQVYLLDATGAATPDRLRFLMVGALAAVTLGVWPIMEFLMACVSWWIVNRHPGVVKWMEKNGMLRGES